MIILKLVYLSLFVSLYECKANEIIFDKKIINQLTKINFENFPTALKIKYAEYKNRNTADSSNWCCSNKYDWTDIPVPTIQRTRTGLYDTDTTVSFQQKYYTSCGFLGMKKCTRYRWSYRMQYYI